MSGTTADLARLLSRAARRFGQAPALVDGDRVTSFIDVDRRSNRLAHALMSLDPGMSPVAMMLPNVSEFVEVDLALIKSGRPKVPVNLRLTHVERRHILSDSGASVVVTDPANADEALDLASEIDTLTSVVVTGTSRTAGVGYEDLVAGGSDTLPDRRWQPDDPSVILYTSGTTGRPKGATASFRSRMAATQNMLLDELDVRPGDGMIHVGPLSHGSGSKTVAYYLAGARNILVSKYDPEGFLGLVESRRATASFMVPTMIDMLVEAARSWEGDRSTLRQISYGGAPIAPAQIRRAVDVLGPILVQVYGSAEAPHPLTVLSREDHLRGLEQDSELLGAAGRPATTVELRIAGADRSPDGVGEIQVRSESVMVGYWENPDATAESFEGGFYKTGDLGRLDGSGYLYIMDRERDMVITGGLNVYPAEVEAALLLHESVAETAVIGVPDEKWGELVTAYVVLRPGYPADETLLAEHCARRLAGYKKPRSFVFVDELPKGSTGKILKSELREAHWAGRARKV